MALVVIRPGLATKAQDRGRPGHRGFGVPVGGAFDRGSHDLANALLGNDPDAASLELTLLGGTYRAEVALAIALAGAPMAALARDPSGQARRLAIPGATTLRAGDVLELGGCSTGARTYLAVRGGWQTPSILGSRSSEIPIQSGAVLPASTSSTPTRRPMDLAIPSGPIRVVDGPDGGDARWLEGVEYRVGPRADRMGLRLEGPTIAASAEPDRPSAPVAPGAVQITGGLPIVLGVAGGTMGGYLHLAHVIAADLDRLGQLRPGDGVSFARVEVAEARQVDRSDRDARRRFLARIRAMAEGY